jgi:hypothetical protein
MKIINNINVRTLDLSNLGDVTLHNLRKCSMRYFKFNSNIY